MFKYLSKRRSVNGTHSFYVNSGSVPVADRYLSYLSDHAFFLCSLNSTKPDCVAKNVRYRQLKAIDDFDA